MTNTVVPPEATQNFEAMTRSFFAAPEFFERVSEGMRRVSEAQLNYNQTLMRANAALLNAWFYREAGSERLEERPSIAAKQNGAPAG